RWPARLQAPHVPVQAVLQQIPAEQKPDEHWLFEVHPSPNEASYRYAAVWTVLVVESPPATRTMLPLSNTACWPCSGPGIEGVTVQVDVPLNSSADASVLLPVDDPPATRSCPLATMLFGNWVI